MSELPPLQLDFGSSAHSALDTSRSIYHASGDGDWVVNLGGAGLQTVTNIPSVASALGVSSDGSGLSPMLLIVLAVGAVWLLKKH